MHPFSNESKQGGVDCATACGVKNTNTDVTNTNARPTAQALLASMNPYPIHYYVEKLLKDDQMLSS